ncbi:MAG: hypothetical protein H6619_02330 [Deltaproteobacteria bacterium]|nr:hypothetical protein [Deltaproteobacteria bacterium]
MSYASMLEEPQAAAEQQETLFTDRELDAFMQQLQFEAELTGLLSDVDQASMRTPVVDIGSDSIAREALPLRRQFEARVAEDRASLSVVEEREELEARPTFPIQTPEIMSEGIETDTELSRTPDVNEFLARRFGETNAAQE